MKQKQRAERHHHILKTAALSLLTILLFFNTAGVLYLLQRHDNDGVTLSTFIVRAVENLNRPLAIDPTTGKQYIPAARLVLPPPPASNNLRPVYSYTAATVDWPDEELQLADYSAIESATTPIISERYSPEAMLDKVPKLQACARGVRITFKELKDDPAVASKRLANGKTAYFHTEQTCNSPELLDYAKQIDSY
jgi:hypothetical protein